MTNYIEEKTFKVFYLYSKNLKKKILIQETKITQKEIKLAEEI